MELACPWFAYVDLLPPRNKDCTQKLPQLFSDRLVIQGAHKSAQIQARRGHDSIYMYNFWYKGIFSYGSSYTAEPVADYGIAHGDEQIHLMPVAGFPAWPEHHRDLKVVDSLVTLWTNFAKHGLVLEIQNWEHKPTIQIMTRATISK